jgi:hypothetical protein
MALELLHLIERARAENPKPLLTADEVAMCTYRAAQLAQAEGHDVGVLLKPHGAGGECPVGRISLDILVDIPDQQEYDAFASADGEDGAPGPATPVWHPLPFKVGECAETPDGRKCSGASMFRVRRPVGLPPGDEEGDVTDPPRPQEPSTEPPPRVTNEDVMEAVDAVYVLVRELRQELDVRLLQIEELAAQPRAIELRVPFAGTARGILKSPE